MNPFQKNKNKIRYALMFFLFYGAASLLILVFSSSCRLYNLERKLDPINEKFLSEARYIITSQEKKIFLELPDSEKENFKKEFWKRRDPDPDTEENEFQMEYYDRLERANELFISEAKPGYLTDRGRIYILFGPPTDRITYPMGADPQSGCREIWYYGNFPVVFTDETCTGSYRLITYDLTELREINLMYMHELNMAISEAQDTIPTEKKLFDFDLSIKKKIIEPDTIEGKIVIRIPYSSLWFKAKENLLEAVLDVSLELKDIQGQIIWEYKDSFTLSGQEEEIKEKLQKRYTIEIPFSLENSLQKIRQGRTFIQAVVKNKTGDESLKKVIEFRVSN